MENTPKYRYPGLNAYTKEDATIFKGRDEDSKNLLTQLLLNKTLVLHAESGTGKSSLIQAGLLPLIKKSGETFYPVTIKLNEIISDKSETLLIEYIIKKIFEIFQDSVKEPLPLLNKSFNTLWEIEKKIERHGIKLLLILDQFENLQAFKTNQIYKLKTELFDLLNSKIPSDIYEKVELKLTSFLDKNNNNEGEENINEEYKFLSQPSLAKVLFVVREDKLGTMSLISDYFPDILKNDFIIKPLSQTDANKALVEPANVDGDFESIKFKYENEVIPKDLIKIISDDETGLVDPVQLQIVARNIERNIVIKNKTTVITNNDIPQIKDIINEFYKDCWDEVEKELQFNTSQKYQVRKKIISELVVNKRRSLANYGELEPLDPLCKSIKILKREGLIRDVPYDDKTTYYQLCHDRLIEPLLIDISNLESRENRLLKNRKRRNVVIVLSIIIFLFIVLALTNQFISNIRFEEEKVLNIVINQRKFDPTFAYKYLKSYYTNATIIISRDILKNLKSFENSIYAFKLNSYPFITSLVDIYDEPEKSIRTITDKYSITTWDTKTNMIINQIRISKGYYFKKKKINGKDLYLVSYGDSLEIQNSHGKIEKRFLSFEYDNNIDLSRDGKYIVIGKKVYNIQHPEKPIGVLPDYPYKKLNDYDQLSTVFLNDSKHIAVGYWGGYKFIYRIDENHKDKIRFTAVFSPSLTNGVPNDRITCLTTDSKDRFLFVGNHQKTIEIWKLDHFDHIDSILNREKELSKYLKQIQDKCLKTRPDNQLQGHSSDINSLAISPDDSLLISTSNDNTAVVWNYRTGKKLSILKGRQTKVKHAGFLGCSTKFYTASDDELLYIWSREKGPNLFFSNQLINFSPFEYYLAGLSEDVEIKKKVYDTVNTISYFNNTLQYILTMPLSNQFPEDSDYLSNLRLSLKEINIMYQNITQKKDFKSAISNTNKSLLYYYYNFLKYSTPDLLLESKNEDKKTKYKRIVNYYKDNSKRYFLDTSAIYIKAAIFDADELKFYGGYYRDSLCDYSNAIYCYELRKQIIYPFYNKFKDYDNLKFKLGQSYGGLSYNYLFSIDTNDYIKIIDNAKKGLELDPHNNSWINTNLALGYLLRKQFKEAEEIYSKYKNKSYDADVNFQTFNDAFLDDFQSLEKAGIISKKNKEIYDEVTRIKLKILKVKM